MVVLSPFSPRPLAVVWTVLSFANPKQSKESKEDGLLEAVARGRPREHRGIKGSHAHIMHPYTVMLTHVLPPHTGGGIHFGPVTSGQS